MMRAAIKLALALFGVAGLQALQAQSYPATPILTTFGPMNCGMRLYSPGLMQTYCLFNKPPAAPATVCNHVDAIYQPSGNSPVTAGVQFCSTTDTDAGQIYQITWMVYAARPPTTAGYVQYQIINASQPCTLNTSTGVCAPSGSQILGTLQQGVTFSNVTTSLVGTVYQAQSDGLVEVGYLSNGPLDIRYQVQTIPGNTYTLQPVDCGTTLSFTSASPVILTIPPGLPPDFTVSILQSGSGIVTPTAASGVTINQRLKLTKTAGQFAWIELASSAQDVYVLSGDLQ